MQTPGEFVGVSLSGPRALRLKRDTELCLLTPLQEESLDDSSGLYQMGCADHIIP